MPDESFHPPAPSESPTALRPLSDKKQNDYFSRLVGQTPLVAGFGWQCKIRRGHTDSGKDIFV